MPSLPQDLPLDMAKILSMALVSYQWDSFCSTTGHRAGEMLINGSVLTLPLHHDQCHLQQVDSIRLALENGPREQ